MSLDYLVTFADVPLLLNTAKVIRQPPPEIPHGQVDKQTPIRKQQPEVDLIDEVNRLMDLGYIQDQTYPFPTQDKKTAELAKRWPINQWPTPKFRVGDFFYPFSMSRWSVYRGLATSSMVQAILTKTYGTGAWPFVMKSNPISPDNPFDDEGAYTVETDLYMLPPRTLFEFGGQFDGLFLITLVDDRYYKQGVSFTHHPNNNSTWSDLLTQLVNLFGINIVTQPQVPAVYKPEVDSQLWGNEIPAAFLFDVACYNVGGVAVRGLDGNYHIYQPWKSREIAYQNRGVTASVARTAGGDMFNHGGDGQILPSQSLTASINSILPQNVNVTFPKYVIGNDPVPHFVNPRYAVPRPSCWYEDDYGDVYTHTVPLLSGGLQFSGGLLGVFVSGSLQLDASGNPYISSGVIGTDGYEAILHSTAKALYSGDVQAASGIAPLNLGGLVPIAQALAYDLYGQQIALGLDETYPGTFAWQPEGLDDIIWRFSARTRQATTRVVRGQWNVPLYEVQHSATWSQSGSVLSGYILSGLTSVPGVGGPSVAQTWKDSYSGNISTILAQTYNSGGATLTLTDVSYLPTQNQWKAVISSGQADYEKMLMAGTSGGLSGGISLIQQGIDGTSPQGHASGAHVAYLTPDTTYGVNLVTFEKGQFVYPSDWKSGGIQGVSVVPQVQTIYSYTSSGTAINGRALYSGQVCIYDMTSSGPDQLVGQEYVWLFDRNIRRFASGNGTSGSIASGIIYEGQLVGYSAVQSGITAPVYATSIIPGSPGSQGLAGSGIGLVNISGPNPTWLMVIANPAFVLQNDSQGVTSWSGPGTVPAGYGSLTGSDAYSLEFNDLSPTQAGIWNKVGSPQQIMLGFKTFLGTFTFHNAVGSGGATSGRLDGDGTNPTLTIGPGTATGLNSGLATWWPGIVGNTNPLGTLAGYTLKFIADASFSGMSQNQGISMLGPWSVMWFDGSIAPVHGYRTLTSGGLWASGLTANFSYAKVNSSGIPISGQLGTLNFANGILVSGV